MVKKIRVKIAIIGAGPSGSICSYFLTKKKIEHFVLEKEEFPREKICGDAFSGRCLSILEKANPEWINEILSRSVSLNTVDEISFYAPNGETIKVPVGKRDDGKPKAFIMARKEFDDILFQKIKSKYATIKQGVRIVEISQTEDNKIKILFVSAQVNYEIICDIVVGADGYRSAVRKSICDKKSTPRVNAVALRAYYSNVTGSAKDKIELYFLSDILPGYFWIFPLGGDLFNVGIGMSSDIVRENKIDLKNKFYDKIRNYPLISSRFSNAHRLSTLGGFGLPFADTMYPIAGNNYILLGDAANLIDPFTGEGIGNAMLSGMLGADAIEKHINGNFEDTQVLIREYQHKIYISLGNEFRIGNALQKIAKNETTLNSFFQSQNAELILKRAIGHI